MSRISSLHFIVASAFATLYAYDVRSNCISNSRRCLIEWTSLLSNTLIVSFVYPIDTIWLTRIQRVIIRFSLRFLPRISPLVKLGLPRTIVTQQSYTTSMTLSNTVSLSFIFVVLFAKINSVN